MLLLILLAILPHSPVVRESFDVIERNAVYSWQEKCKENGDVDYELKHTFDQLLFRRWNVYTGTHEIEAWRMVKPGMVPQEINGRWELRWTDNGIERVIQARTFTETAADFDREVSERERWQKSNRSDLRGLRRR